jgi:hypothetical protein
MTERFALYFAPARDSRLWERAQAWLAQGDLAEKTVSARRYGFHATIKAPMTLKAGTDRAGLEAALRTFGETAGPVELSGLAPRLIDGFLALTTEPQPVGVTRLAETVTLAFEPFRAPLSEAEMARRLQAPLTPRQVELLKAYGYPYVMDQFLLHMTLTDRLAVEEREAMVARAAAWFGDTLAEPIMLDRLVLFREPAPGADFERLDDYPLSGRA